MSNQLQCPNCWGYQTSIVKQRPTFQERTLPVSLGLWVTGAVLLSALLLAAAGLFSYGFHQLGIFWDIDEIVAWTLTISLLGTIPGAVKRARAGTLALSLRQKTGTRFDLLCKICNYRWVWDDRSPYPRVTTEVDQNASEAARLEAAEAERLDQVEAALYRSQRETTGDQRRP